MPTLTTSVSYQSADLQHVGFVPIKEVEAAVLLGHQDVELTFAEGVVKVCGPLPSLLSHTFVVGLYVELGYQILSMHVI